MARQLRYFTIEDSRNMVLSSEIIAIVGAAPNGSTQGNFVVAATTKATAAARATEVIGHTFHPRQFHEAVGGDAQAIIHARLLLGEGDVAAWRQAVRDARVVRVARGRPDVEVVAHWRMDRNNLNLVPAHRDPELLPTRPVAVALPEARDQYVSSGRRCNIYPAGVSVYSDDGERIDVPRGGRIDREQAEELMRGLAGALAELEARPARTEATS